MGLVAPGEVQDMTVLDSPDCNSLVFSDLGCPDPSDSDCVPDPSNPACRKLRSLKAGSISTTTIGDVIATHGARVPDSTTSQKAFRTAYVLVSQAPASLSEMAFLNVQSELFGAPVGNGKIKSFAEATGGLATMDTTLPAILGSIFSNGFESGDASAWSLAVP